MQERIESPQTPDLMTFEEFFAFVETRPDEEKWELFDGVKIMQASANNRHQVIAGNFTFLFGLIERQSEANWAVLPGIGVHYRISPHSAPLPDVVIRLKSTGTEHYVDDVLVVIEILSRSTEKRDLGWKLSYYSSLPALQHYVVASQNDIAIRHFARDDGWQERKLQTLTDVLSLPAINANLTLIDIYRDTGLLA
jgi:Uma2 family endonuclease